MSPTLRQDVHYMLQRYLDIFPGERQPLLRLNALLQSKFQSSAGCFDRTNMAGHVTVSAAVLSPDRSRILLVHDAATDLWQPPGGHYEAPGSLWDAAASHVQDMANVGDVALHPWCVSRGMPVDIQTYVIPENPQAGEGSHPHHDFRYLAVARDAVVPIPSDEAAPAVRWTPREYLAGSRDARLVALARKLDAFV